MDPRDAGAIEDLPVLVVDDNAINRRVMRGVLERASARVDEASDGLEALALSRDPAIAPLIGRVKNTVQSWRKLASEVMK